MARNPAFCGALLCCLVAGLGCADAGERRVRCNPGDLVRDEGVVKVCNADGDGYRAGSCGPQQAFVPNECTEDGSLCRGTCRDIVCTPGEKLCDALNVNVLECDVTGTTARACGSCAAPPVNGVCYKGECVALCGAEQKSYIGCEYYAVDMDNAYVPCDYDEFGNLLFCDAAGAQFAVVLANTDNTYAALVNITNGPPRGQAPSSTCEPAEPDDTVAAAAIIPPRGIQIFHLPRRDVDGTVHAQLAYRIASNIPISAYQFNPLENVGVFSNDASILLPVNTAGNDYLVMSREQSFAELKGQLVVVGVTEQPADVTVTVTAKTLGGEGIPPLNPGESYTTRLRRFEVLSIETNEVGSDLTGSRVRASRPVQVFGGSEAANAPTTSLCNLETMTCKASPSTSCACTATDGPACNPHEKCSDFITCCADHLEMQMFPLSTWGKDYVAVRSFPRHDEMDVWRILASEDDTEVTLTGDATVIPTLDSGKWFEFESTHDFVISATKPIMVGQFLATQQSPTPGQQPGDADIGDPAFMLTPPIRQFRDNYVFLAPDKYALDYISAAVADPSTALLDNTPISAISNALITPIPGSSWIAVRVPIGDGFHSLVCPETCSLMVHGYDQYVSYGYPGGLNLSDE